MKKFKVRFHLGKGKNFMKWQVTSPGGIVKYFDPKDTQLRLVGCLLKNHKKVAQTIFNGANKTVCAWVLCEDIHITTDLLIRTNRVPFGVDPEMQVRYNPRVQPNWVYEDKIVDNCKFSELVSVDRGLFINTK